MASDLIQIDYESMEVISDRFLDQAELIDLNCAKLRYGTFYPFFNRRPYDL